jgi:hypothetical protein
MSIHPDLNPILRKLDHWGVELDERSRDLATAIRRAAVTRHTAELEHAKAIQRATGTVADRESAAVVACEDVLRDRRVAEAEVDALKALTVNAKTQMERLRSWNSAATTSVQDSGSRTAP